MSVKWIKLPDGTLLNTDKLYSIQKSKLYHHTMILETEEDRFEIGFDSDEERDEYYIWLIENL